MPPRRPSRTVPTVVIPGQGGSGRDHWQTWLEGELQERGRETYRPAFPDPGTPELTTWLAALRATLEPLPADAYDVVAHSLGALLWLHHVTAPGSAPRPARVALVCPPSPSRSEPALATFVPPPLDLDAVRAGADGTVLVGTDDDPFLPEGITAAYGVPLKIATTVVPAGGHLDPDSGYGPWPGVLNWCLRDKLAFY